MTNEMRDHDAVAKAAREDREDHKRSVAYWDSLGDEDSLGEMSDPLARLLSAECRAHAETKRLLAEAEELLDAISFDFDPDEEKGPPCSPDILARIVAFRAKGVKK